MAFISEGTANYGIELTFPKKDRIFFEKYLLFPLAGLDTGKVEKYYEILDLVSKLGYASTECARKYLDDKISTEECIQQIMEFNLKSREHAEKNISFYDKYRAYLINYTYGQELVKTYVEKHAFGKKTLDDKWLMFIELMSKPILPSDLKI